MKDFGYYKNIINQNYNPEKKTLTKGNFYRLHKRILDGDESASQELFQLTCYFAYDAIAHAYVEGLFHGEFEDDLQETFLMLKEISFGGGPSRKKTPYFANLPVGTSYKYFITIIMTLAFKNLDKKARKNFSPVDINKSLELNQLLQNPEAVAIGNISRPQIAKIVEQSGVGKHDDAKQRHGKWFYDLIINGYRCEEVAEDEKVSTQAIYYAFNKSVNAIKNDPPRQKELEELLH